MEKLVIFGAGKIAQVAAHYFAVDSNYQVIAFTCDREYAQSDQFGGLPLVAFDEIERRFGPGDCQMFVALGYHQMNALRAARLEQARSKGYRIASYVSSRAGFFGKLAHGENCFVLENQLIQPFVRLGQGVFVWNGVLVGHHSRIGDHCWLTSSACIGSDVDLGAQCFLGMNSTVGHGVRVGDRCLLGAGALVTQDVEPDGVYAVRNSERHRLPVDVFLRLSRLK